MIMKAEDLMIGDWVYHKGDLVRVDILSTSKENLCVSDGIESYIALYKDLEPAYITRELLERNGFVEDVGFYSSDFFNLHQIVDSTYSISNTAMRVSYVHELQHALRLCGCEREIVL